MLLHFKRQATLSTTGLYVYLHTFMYCAIQLIVKAQMQHAHAVAARSCWMEQFLLPIGGFAGEPWAQINLRVDRLFPGLLRLLSPVL